MITDEKIEQAVDYLRENALKAAKAKAERIYMEEYRKVVKALLMREVASESLGGQEARAYADKRYTTHLDALQGAIERDEYHRWMMVAAQAKIEAWRTQQSTQRVLGKLG